MLASAIGVSLLASGLARQPDLFCGAFPHSDLRSGRQAPPRLLPRDEAASNPEFAQFLKELLAAVARRDAQAVLKVTAADFKMDFGGGDGIDYLRRALESGDDDFWAEFPRAIALGGTFNETGFAAPYVYSVWPDDLDSYECAAIVGRGVRLRARPDPAAEPMARLEYDIVETLSGVRTVSGWTHVRTAAGVTGYVASEYVRSPVDYRARFSLTGGQWKLAAFIAGD